MNATTVENRNAYEAQLARTLGEEGFALFAHDVRSSLFGLLGSLDLIKDESLDPDTRAQIMRARASGVLLNDLLDQAFGGEAIQNPIDPLIVEEELHSVVQRWLDQADKMGINLHVQVQEGIPELDTLDRIGFQRVFNNLVGNAVKFSAGGDVLIDVKRGVSGGVDISVNDEGPGFSDASLATLFQFRGRPADSPQVGSGLGLFISKSLVEEMGGKIAVQNRDTGGACVTVSLSARDNTQKTYVPDNSARSTLPDLSHLNILLAEDNVTNQLVVTQMLKSMNGRYKVASDGVEALELFEAEEFDVVLLDIEMPRKSGLEVLREIRGRADQKSGTALIALTAYVMQEHRGRIEAAGADGIIAKPIAGIAALGNLICEYAEGAQPASQGTRTTAGVDEPCGDVGHVNPEVFDLLAATIGADSLSEFLDKVIIDFENISIELINAEAADDSKAIRANSHILISVAGAIGAQSLQHFAEDLNRAARSGNKLERQSLNLSCIKGVSEVVEFLNLKKVSSDPV